MRKQHIQQDKTVQAAGNNGKPPVSRRDFLWRATMLGAGLAVQAPLTAMANGTDTARDAQDAQFAARRAKNKNKTGNTQNGPHVESHVHINQVGYLPNEAKRAVIPASAPIPGSAFSILDDDATPKVRYQSDLTPYLGMGAGTLPSLRHRGLRRVQPSRTLSPAPV